jgi:hypothetical protein
VNLFYLNELLLCYNNSHNNSNNMLHYFKVRVNISIEKTNLISSFQVSFRGNESSKSKSLNYRDKLSGSKPLIYIFYNFIAVSILK